MNILDAALGFLPNAFRVEVPKTAIAAEGTITAVSITPNTTKVFIDKFYSQAETGQPLT